MRMGNLARPFLYIFIVLLLRSQKMDEANNDTSNDSFSGKKGLPLGNILIYSMAC